MANTAITKKKKKQMVIGLVIVAVLIVAFAWYSKSKKNKQESAKSEKIEDSSMSEPIKGEVKAVNEAIKDAPTENSTTEPTKTVMTNEKA